MLILNFGHANRCYSIAFIMLKKSPCSDIGVAFAADERKALARMQWLNMLAKSSPYFKRCTYIEVHNSLAAVQLVSYREYLL